MRTLELTGAGWVKPDPLSDPQSIERRFRARRFAHVRSLIDECLTERGRVDILDLGGTEQYWAVAEDYLKDLGNKVSITLLNNEVHPPCRGVQFVHLMGDACDPDLFAERRFDLVHSNSVIEHVGEKDRMRAFAKNVYRLSARHFVQTPNYWFPLEPHFRVLGFQWLPLPVRAALMRRFNLGFFPRAETPEEAWDNVREIRLLDQSLMRELFAGSEIKIEKVAGLSKSIMAIGRPGWDDRAEDRSRA